MSDWARTPSGIIVPEHAVKPKRLPTAIDLFCGCGGFSLGFMQAGFEVLAGVDFDLDATVTYLVNLGSYPCHIEFIEDADKERAEKGLRKFVGLDKVKDKSIRVPPALPGTGWIKHNPDVPPVRHFFFGDIRKLSGERLLKAIGKQVGEVDAVIGGPPCQGFSTAGKRNIMDPRNSLVFEFARLICEIQPKTFVMENVPAIQSMVTPEGIPIVDAFCRVVQDGGFGSWEALKKSLLISSGAGLAMKSRLTKHHKKEATEDDNEEEREQLALFAR